MPSSFPSENILHAVSAVDAGSTYEPHPTLTYEWDPQLRTRSEYLRHQGSSGHSNGGRSFELGPHPADPHSSVMPIAPPGSPMNGKTASGRTEESPGQEIWVYGGNGGYVRHCLGASPIPMVTFFTKDFHFLALHDPYSFGTP